MADGINRVVVLGNVGDEPELRFTQDNRAILKFRLATTESYLDANQQRKESTQWHSVTLFGPRGEALSKYIHKGSRLLAEGRLEYRTYDGNDGVKRYVTDIVATNIVLLDGARQDGARDDRRAAPRRDDPPARPQPAQGRGAAPPSRGGGPPPARPQPAQGRGAPADPPPDAFGGPQRDDDDSIPF